MASALTDEITAILKQLQAQAPEVLEMGVRKIRTTAELQIAGMAIEWVGFLVAAFLLIKMYRRWRKLDHAARSWKYNAHEERPDYPSDAHDVAAVVAVVFAVLLIFIVTIQVGWYLPDQVSYIVNARYYAVLELIHQIRG
jgi:predicted histidine transporter YuiF (NhaC family)